LRERDIWLNDRRVLTPQQSRAARTVVGWSEEKLVERSGVPAIATKQFENGDTDPSSLNASQMAPCP